MGDLRIPIALLIVASTSGCREAAKAAATHGSLSEIAAGWSGGRTDPTCQDKGPRGEYLGHIPSREYCQWPTVARGPEWSTVGGHRDTLFGLTDLTWERRFRSTVGVAQLADSLAREFRAQGLRELPCPKGSRRWQTTTLGVLLTPAPPINGMPRVTIFVTTMADALPDFPCPATRAPATNSA